MADLSIDIETRSSVEIRKAGLYRTGMHSPRTSKSCCLLTRWMMPL